MLRKSFPSADASLVSDVIDVSSGLLSVVAVSQARQLGA